MCIYQTWWAPRPCGQQWRASLNLASLIMLSQVRKSLHPMLFHRADTPACNPPPDKPAPWSNRGLGQIFSLKTEFRHLINLQPEFCVGCALIKGTKTLLTNWQASNHRKLQLPACPGSRGLSGHGSNCCHLSCRLPMLPSMCCRPPKWQHLSALIQFLHRVLMMKNWISFESCCPKKMLFSFPLKVGSRFLR